MTEETAEKPAGAGWQTQAYLMNLLTANGLRPNRDLGQNFLIDLNLMRVLEEAAALSKDDVILEVGTGTGALTNRLAHGAGMLSRSKRIVGSFVSHKRRTAQSATSRSCKPMPWRPNRKSHPSFFRPCDPRWRKPTLLNTSWLPTCRTTSPRR